MNCQKQNSMHGKDALKMIFNLLYLFLGLEDLKVERGPKLWGDFLFTTGARRGHTGENSSAVILLKRALIAFMQQNKPDKFNK